MGQSQAKLKITNNASQAVICHIIDFENKPIQQAIAPKSTFTLDTFVGYHTISVYPLGTTEIQGVKAETSYDLDVSSEELININQKGGFLNISRQIGDFCEGNVPNSICNKTDEAVLVVVTNKDGKFFEQVLLKDDSYKFYSPEGKTTLSVFKPGGSNSLTTYSFIGKRVSSNQYTADHFHWEASITKVENLFNIGVIHKTDLTLYSLALGN